jgi:transposase-like protein
MHPATQAIIDAALRQQRKAPASFKTFVTTDRRDGMSIAAIARKYNITTHQVRVWTARVRKGSTANV